MQAADESAQAMYTGKDMAPRQGLQGQVAMRLEALLQEMRQEKETNKRKQEVLQEPAVSLQVTLQRLAAHQAVDLTVRMMARGMPSTFVCLTCCLCRKFLSFCLQQTVPKQHKSKYHNRLHCHSKLHDALLTQLSATR